MARRKGTSRRKPPASRAAARSRKTARKRTAPARTARTVAKRKTARKTGTRKAARAKTARKAAAGKPVVKATARKPVARTAARRRAAPKRPAPKRSAPKTAARPAAPPIAKASSTRSGTGARKAPAISRERRTIADVDFVPTPPSTLDLDRSASAMRTGRRELRDRFAEHTETGPTLTGGDVDADWESAYSVGDEAPGGDNPTPDQDIVDEIGRAVGVEYQDNEELKGEEKIAQRDRHRWELDPASSEDYEDR